MFCTSFGFLLASLLTSSKNHSSDASISNSPQTERIKEVSAAPLLSEIPKGM
jgi:hypothetical protein